MMLTRERLERAATENQFMNGKIQAISVRVNLENGFKIDQKIDVSTVPQ